MQNQGGTFVEHNESAQCIAECLIHGMKKSRTAGHNGKTVLRKITGKRNTRFFMGAEKFDALCQISRSYRPYFKNTHRASDRGNMPCGVKSPQSAAKAASNE